MSFNYELTPRESARLDAICARAESDLGAERLTASREDLLTCPSIRLAIISDSGLSENYLDEVKRLKSVESQLKTRAMGEALANLNADTHRELSRLNPSQRMSLGRQLEAQKQTQEAPPVVSGKMDAELFSERLALLRTLSPDVRITTARKWGMI